MAISDDDLARQLAVAAAAAKLTRGLLSEGRLQRRAPVSQIGHDIKLSEDARSEAIIRDYLSQHSAFAVLGEESGWGAVEADEHLPYWVVDPLDGSFNYYRGIPLYAVSIALCVGQKPLLGAIYDPERDELFCGGAGLGFSINGESLKPRGVAGQILATGFPSQADVEATSGKIAALARDWTKVRMLGTAALSLAWVAAGRLDGYSESGIMWWDVAAGIAIAEGAGVSEIVAERLHGHALHVLVTR